MRYHLRTLLIVLAIVPPLLAAGWWAYQKLRIASDERAVWNGELSLIHGSGQTVERDEDSTPPGE